MMFDLRVGDKLARPNKPESYWEVLDSRIHAGTIQVFDADKRQARFVDDAEIRAGISDGALILHRKGMPRVGIPAQYADPVLHARVSQLQEALRRIGSIQRQLDLSFDAAISRARFEYLEENAGNPMASSFPSRATLFRAHKNQVLGLPVLKRTSNSMSVPVRKNVGGKQ